MSWEEEDVVLCPPDRSIPVAWLRFKQALQQELTISNSRSAAAAAAAAATEDGACQSSPASPNGSGASSPTHPSSSASFRTGHSHHQHEQQQHHHQQQQQYAELLQLIELLTHSRYSADARYLQSAMMLAQPQLSEEERQLLHTMDGGTCAADQQSCDQQLLSVIIRLLLEARYTPLTKEEWDIAQEHNFTFDIPVSINWKVLDDKLLTCFWQQQQQKQKQQQQQPWSGGSDGSSTTSTDSDTGDIDSSSSSSSSSSSNSSTDSPTLVQQQQQQQQYSPTLLDQSQLPAFSDRLLVFHRGVGVATAPGLYLTQKMDLLVDYIILKPVVDSFTGMLSRTNSKLTKVKEQSQQMLSAVKPDQHQQQQVEDVEQQNQQQQQQQQSQQQYSGHISRQYSLSLASGSVDHPAARVVVRRSLQSLMPGPREVLKRFWEPLVLQEPTYRSVVVLYRAAASTPPPAPSSAETAATAALQIGVGDWLAAGAAVAAAQSAAEAQAAAAAAAAAVAADTKAAVVNVASEAKAAASTAIRAAKQSLTPHAAAAAAAREARESMRMRENPYNLIIKSFADVAVADLELVMPSKQVQVQAVTLVRSTLAALGALAAFAALLQQAGDVGWSPSLVFLPAVGLVAGRAIKVLTTIKSHQASLTSTMLSMAYNAARDSQSGVLCKLVDELRDSATKETALAFTALLLNCWTTGDGSSSSTSGSSNSSNCGDSFTFDEVDAASEAFLERRFGLQVDLVTSDALDQLVQWGVVHEVSSGRYQAVPLQQAVHLLRGQALRSVSGLQQQQQLGQYSFDTRSPDAACGGGCARDFAAEVEAAAAAAAAAERLGRVNAVNIDLQQRQRSWLSSGNGYVRQGAAGAVYSRPRGYARLAVGRGSSNRPGYGGRRLVHCGVVRLCSG